MLLKIGHQLVVNKGSNKSGNIGVTELALCLSFKLRFRKLNGNDCGNAFSYVVAGKLFVIILKYAELFAVVVENTG